MTIAQWIAALMPVLSVAILLVVLRMPASRAMPIALVITIALAMVARGGPALQISASVIEGLIVAGSVALIALHGDPHGGVHGDPRREGMFLA